VHSTDILRELPKSAFQGHVDAVEIEKIKDEEDKDPKPSEGSKSPPHLKTLISLHDFESIAKSYLPATAWAYYSSGADDEISKRNNARAFSKIALRPRVLRKISSVNTATSVLGFPSSLPIYISPVGIAKFAHADGECALAAAAGKEGIVQVLADGSSMPIEQVVRSRTSPDQPIFQQLYVNKDLNKSIETIRRAEQAGAGALWITVDSPVVGKREMDERLNLSVSVRSLGVLVFDIHQTDMFQATDDDKEGQGVAKTLASSISPYIDWEILTWVRQLTDLPLVIKGIQCVEDAVIAYQHGVQGIVLSNHGGRSQDT
jgi:L-lactate dehydrogenase (cytochrome)